MVAHSRVPPTNLSMFVLIVLSWSCRLDRVRICLDARAGAASWCRCRL